MFYDLDLTWELFTLNQSSQLQGGGRGANRQSALEVSDRFMLLSQISKFSSLAQPWRPKQMGDLSKWEGKTKNRELRQTRIKLIYSFMKRQNEKLYSIPTDKLWGCQWLFRADVTF